MTLRTLALCSALALTLPFAGQATDACNEDAMIVFDGSGSMSEMGFNSLDEPRIFEARRAVRKSIPWIAQFRRLGLIVYGPGEGDSCTNIDLRFGPTENAADLIISSVDDLAPEGMTALTASVEKAAETLNYRSKPAVVVLVTDGKETCGGAPCALADQLLREASNLTIHVIGYKVRADFFSWGNPEHTDRYAVTTVAKCMADKSGGLYVSAETVDELSRAMEKTLGCQIIGSVQSRTRLSSRS